MPVASLPRNPWGLYEMHGNVWGLPGCNAFGDTPTEAIQEMEDAMASWLQAWVSLGRALPAPKTMPQQAA